jgi:uncharacterized protein YjbJ (UPF0337 family)
MPPTHYGTHAWQTPRADIASVHLFLEQIMGINKDQVKGRAEEAKGKVKEVVGKAVGNKELELKGNVQKNVGAVQASVGDAKSDLAHAIKTH